MNEPLKKFSKKLLPEADDLLLRVMARTDGGDGFAPLSFKRERIDYLTEVSPGVSGMALKNGVKIAVAMAYEDLERSVYFADIGADPVLDLRSVTGANVTQTLPALSPVFTDAAAVDSTHRPMVNKQLKIAVFVRQNEEQNFQMFFITDDRIDWGKVEALEQGKNGKATKLALLYDKGPFGENKIIIDMPRPAFMEAYSKAKMEGATELDLRDWTRRRDPDKTPPPKPSLG